MGSPAAGDNRPAALQAGGRARRAASSAAGRRGIELAPAVGRPAPTLTVVARRDVHARASTYLARTCLPASFIAVCNKRRGRRFVAIEPPFGPVTGFGFSSDQAPFNSLRDRCTPRGAGARTGLASIAWLSRRCRVGPGR